jgi:hypothetical protein
LSQPNEHHAAVPADQGVADLSEERGRMRALYQDDWFTFRFADDRCKIKTTIIYPFFLAFRCKPVNFVGGLMADFLS